MPMEVRRVLVEWRVMQRAGMQGTKALRSRMGDLISASLDLGLARPFYDVVMAALSCDKVYDLVDAIGYSTRSNAEHAAHTYLSVFASQEAALDERRHWCFKARTRDAVHAFYTAALAHGGSSDGAPGLRPHYHAS